MDFLIAHLFRKNFNQTHIDDYDLFFVTEIGMLATDLLFLSLIAVLILVDHLVLWPTFLRRSKSNPHRARLRLWFSWMSILWVLVAIGVCVWVHEVRTWESLRLTVPHGWKLWGTVGLIMAFTVVKALPILKVARSKRRVRYKMGSTGLERLLPQTAVELSMWIGLSLSAAVGEEFIFRGYLIWFFEPTLGLYGAAGLSAIAFGLAHAYQGFRGILITALGALLFTATVFIFDSLLPAIVLHAILDISAGTFWFYISKSQSANQVTSPLLGSSA